MTSDQSKVVAGSSSEGSPAATPPAADSPKLNDLQQAIVARARETIERREARSHKPWVQRAIALGLSLVLALIAFVLLNFLVATIQRFTAEYSATKEAERLEAEKQERGQSVVTEPNEDASVILIQPDRTLDRPSAPQPPAAPGERQ